jgi:hypothetical protein
MPIFELQGPDGASYEVDAPDEASALTAFKKIPAMPTGGLVPSSDTGLVDTAEDVAKSAGSGLAKGVVALPGLPADAMNLADHGWQWLVSKGLEKAGVWTPEQAEKARQPLPGLEDGPTRGILPTGQGMIRAAEKAGVPFHEPQTTAGEYAHTIGEFAPGALLAPGSLVRRGALTLSSALGSETAGQAAEKFAPEYEPYARFGGAILGPGFAAGASRAITPLPVSAERQALVNALRNEGVTDITAGQATGRKGLQYFESEMGGPRAAQMIESQGDQFTRAALRRVGEDAPRATPEVIDNAFTRIGGQFDDLATRNAANLDADFGRQVGDIHREYNQLVPETHRAPIVENTVNDLAVMMSSGQPIDGATYQAMRSRLDRAARGAARDPQLSEALYGLRNSLDDAMERSIATTNPADAGAWREARNQYRNLLVLERAATGAGSDAAEGLISPSHLRNATVNVQGRRNYARGDGDFAELARAGEAVLKPLPNSGTAPRLKAQGVARALTGGIGAMAGATVGGAPGGAIGAALGAIAPEVIGRAAMSTPSQRLLANQLLANAGIGADAQRAALAQALLQSRQLEGQAAR